MELSRIMTWISDYLLCKIFGIIMVFINKVTVETGAMVKELISTVRLFRE